MMMLMMMLIRPMMMSVKLEAYWLYSCCIVMFCSALVVRGKYDGWSSWHRWSRRHWKYAWWVSASRISCLKDRQSAVQPAWTLLGLIIHTGDADADTDAAPASQRRPSRRLRCEYRVDPSQAIVFGLSISLSVVASWLGGGKGNFPSLNFGLS